MRSNQPYEEGFLIILILLAVVGLLWLFSPFLEALFFAMILATATYSLYLWALPRVKNSPTYAAGAVSLGVFITVIAPVSYLLVEVSFQVGSLYGQVQEWLNQQTPESLAATNQQLLNWFGLEPEVERRLLEQVKENTSQMISFAQNTVVFLVQGVIGSTTSFITFISLSTFALFFFYRDGARISHHLKVLSPLENYYDSLIMERFASLSSVLLLSILGIALMQGVSFVILAWFLGLPALFIGMAIAVTSFIPIVGAALVWVPIMAFMVFNGEYVGAGLVVFWGAVINGFFVDNIMRPILINKISQSMHNGGADLEVANHTLITVLSTFAGLIHFGMIGLFFGPVIAAMAITIFEVYEQKHRNILDRT